MLPASVSVTVVCFCGDQIYDLTHAVKQEAFGVKCSDAPEHAGVISHSDHEIQWPDVKSGQVGGKGRKAEKKQRFTTRRA